MAIQIHKHGIYIILISRSCQKWDKTPLGFQQQLTVTSAGTLWQSWNPSAEFLLVIMGTCMYFEGSNISRSILSEFWPFQVTSATVLYLKSSEHWAKHLSENTSDSAQDKNLELHTWYPYENSESCSPAEGTIHVKVSTVRHLSISKTAKYTKTVFFGAESEYDLRICPNSFIFL
jgi:hypothetical protein